MTPVAAASLLIERARRLSAIARLHPFDATTPQGRSDERYRRIILATATGMFARGMSAAASLAIVPLLLTYLGKEQFGLWSATLALTAWVALLDFGMSPALVNALSEAHGKGDRSAAARYASTGLAVVGGSAVAGAIALALVGSRLSWATFLGIADEIPSALATATLLTSIAVALAGLPFGVVQACYAGSQTLHVANAFAAVASMASVTMTWMAIRFHATLPWLVGAMGASTLGVSMLSTLALRRVSPWLVFRLNGVTTRAVLRLGRTALPAWLFVIGALAVNQSQAIILARLASLQLVAEYAVLLRVIQILSGIVGLSTSAFVPTYREAAERGDLAWLRKSFRRALWLRMILAAAVVILLLTLGNELVRLWLHREDIRFPPAIWVAASALVAAATWVNAYSDLLMALDRIWIQVILVMLNGAVTIALTILATPRLGLLGALVAVAATTVLVWTWLFPRICRPLLGGRR